MEVGAAVLGAVTDGAGAGSGSASSAQAGASVLGAVVDSAGADSGGASSIEAGAVLRAALDNAGADGGASSTEAGGTVLGAATTMGPNPAAAAATARAFARELDGTGAGWPSEAACGGLLTGSGLSIGWLVLAELATPAAPRVRDERIERSAWNDADMTRPRRGSCVEPGGAVPREVDEAAGTEGERVSRRVAVDTVFGRELNERVTRSRRETPRAGALPASTEPPAPATSAFCEAAPAFNALDAADRAATGPTAVALSDWSIIRCNDLASPAAERIATRRTDQRVCALGEEDVRSCTGVRGSLGCYAARERAKAAAYGVAASALRPLLPR